MSQLSCGLVGLPNAGKSTLFNALTRGHAEVAPYPFCTIEPNVGAVAVRDPRLDRVAALAGVGKIIYQHVEYVDVAGLVKDASKGAGRGNQFLEHIRACDAVVQVVRCFEDDNVAHVQGSLDPVEDARTVNLELMLADLETAGRNLERQRKRAIREADAKPAADALQRAHDHLNAGKPVRTLTLPPEERHLLDPYRFLTARPALYVANVGEADLPGEQSGRVRALAAYAAAEGGAVVPVCAKLEAEVAELDPAEAQAFLKDAGLAEPGLERVVRATARLLGLISFFTFNETEARAWTIPQGATAVQAAGRIHTDFAQKFIRAEVTAFADFDACGGEKGAREKGHLRVEGRDYVVRDADVIYFRIAP